MHRERLRQAQEHHLRRIALRARRALVRQMMR
jgi:hypothetical protein